ncbi:LysR family transcriptional regulator [Bordetella sp. LUAb4]|uniref:LysR family transcriptional regulator n=1 Tax=Bordetella sp. LUAb4 TaxID=2843195 RepID=UPI001E4DB5D5|nr:LysR family transcriptional regulator [Bordetella sp. LUAb4]
MELRQLRSFARVVELGSMGRAAAELGIVTSALSQQISRLESELATRLLQRTSTGVVPTDAGRAFLRQAQLAIRHADAAAMAAREARLTGQVSVGLASTTGTVLAPRFIQAMQQRYPDVRLRMTESLSGHLASMLNARQLDLAIVFNTDSAQRWTVQPLLDERLLLMGQPSTPGWPTSEHISLAGLHEVPLVLPSPAHGLRQLIDAACARIGRTLNIAAEVDGLAMLMAMVRVGHVATIQPGAALPVDPSLSRLQLTDEHLHRRNMLVSLPEDELSPAALAARVVLSDVARTLVREGGWPGATLYAGTSEAPSSSK